MRRIEVFQTHIEVSPYTEGENFNLEKKFSKWDEITHRYIPISYYIKDDTLYLPRGASLNLLTTAFDCTPIANNIYDRFDYFNEGEPIKPPKSIIQQEAIEFLLGENKFDYSYKFSQLGLNLSTGDGKTYSAIYSITKQKIKSIIFTHQTKIKNQWIKAFKEMTSIDNDTLIDINNSNTGLKVLSGEISGNIYFMNYQTAESLARNYGWDIITDLFNKIRVGIKVYDEAHKFFNAMLKIDFFTNTKKTYYLTATYGRSDKDEQRLYNNAFSHLTRFGEETLNYDVKRRHVNFIACYFNSRPPYNQVPYLKTPKGFSAYKYIDYELEEEHKTLLRAIYNVLDKVIEFEGKILVLSPKIDSTEIIAKAISEEYNEPVGVIHSKISPENIAIAKEQKIICSTIKSLGTGVNIEKLRCIINTEPMGSNNVAAQTVGRLREYSPDLDTYFFHLVDHTVKETIDSQKRIVKGLKKLCKSIITTKLNI